jgi:hypothetical protein
MTYARYVEENKDNLKPILGEKIYNSEYSSSGFEITPGGIYCLTGDSEQEIWDFIKSTKRSIIGYFAEWKDGLSLEQAQELMNLIKDQEYNEKVQSLELAIGYINVDRSPHFDNRLGFKTGPLNVESIPTFLLFENYLVTDPEDKTKKVIETKEKTPRIVICKSLPYKELFKIITQRY